MRVEA